MYPSGLHYYFLYFAVLAFPLSSLTSCRGKVVKYRFAVSYIPGAPDGVQKDNILGINGHFPGPTIHANVRDTIEIDVINKIQDGQNVSIHWHGIHQREYPFEDGAAMISQCPLPSGKTQKYRFKVSQTGTYWYHSHVNAQYTEGLWGIMIIHNEPIEAFPYDSEIIIALNEWYHRTAEENERWHFSVAANGVPPFPDSGLMNGLGRVNCEIARRQKRNCLEKLQLRPIFPVHANKTYRIRVINAGAYPIFDFSIPGHKLRVIEVDGIDLDEEVKVDSAMIAAAQRYSFLLRIDQSKFDERGRLLIRADMRNKTLMLPQTSANINPYPEAILPDVTGVLQIVSDYHSDETVSFERHTWKDVVPALKMPENAVYLKDNMMKPNREAAPSSFDQEIVADVGFYEDKDNVRRGAINRVYFELPTDEPVLMKLVEGKPLPSSVIPVYVEHMDIVQVVINNDFYGPHPFHLHGSHFWVMGAGKQGDGNYTKEVHEKGLTRNGAVRDTVLVEEKSWAVIRFKADNPTVLTFHCHIDWHLLTGMGMTFVMGKDVIRDTLKVTPEARKICDMWKR